jgi:hypothetical protein
MIPKKPVLGLDPRMDTGFRTKIMLETHNERIAIKT